MKKEDKKDLTALYIKFQKLEKEFLIIKKEYSDFKKESMKIWEKLWELEKLEYSIRCFVNIFREDEDRKQQDKDLNENIKEVKKQIERRLRKV